MRLLLVAVVLIAGGAVAVNSWNQRREATATSSRDRVIYDVNRISFDMTIPASGELEALHSIEIRSEVESQVTITFIIDEGKQVKEGDLLVSLGSESIETKIAEEDLRVEAAKADLVAAREAVELQLNENESDEAKATSKLKITTLELQRWQEGEDVTRFKDLNLAIEKATRNVKRFTREYHDSEALLEEGFESQSKVDEDEIRMIEAHNDLEKSTLALEVYEKYERPKLIEQKTSDLREAGQDLGRLIQRGKSRLAQREADFSSKERQYSLREERFNKLQNQLKNCTITAPSDGLVVYGTSVGGMPWRRPDPLQIGQNVHPNRLLIILPDTSTMVASVKVHETQSSQIKPGMPVTIRVDAMPNSSLTGTIQSIGVLAEQAGFSQVREYSVKILIDGTNEAGLKPSMRCKSEINLGHAENVIAIPVQGVFVERRKHFVWVPAGRGKFETRNVETGRMSETMIEIVNGLEEGDRILLAEPRPGERAP